MTESDMELGVVTVPSGDLAYSEAAHRQFGGDLISRHGGQVRGWLDLPLDDAKKLGEALNGWEGDEQGRGVMNAVDEHTDFHRFNHASWTHPLRITSWTTPRWWPPARPPTLQR